MRKFAILFITLILMLSLFSGINVSASDNIKAKNDIFAVSRGGDTSRFPQNSIEAIEACLELNIDAVSATARKTKDGKIVLFEQESTKDICVDKSGKRVDKKISETDYKTLSSYFLLSPGSKNLSRKTNSKITLMTDAFEAIKGKMIMIIDCDEAILDDVYEEIFLGGFAHDVIFRCNEMKTEDLLSWASSKVAKPEIIASYHGNVIFSAINKYNFAENNNICAAEFTTKNPYGVVYSDFFTSRFSGIKVVAPVYDENLCGKRPDNISGWEDLISRGYNIIETANAKEFSAYISLLEENLNSLENVYNNLKDTDLSRFTPASTENFKNNLENAEKILKAEKTASVAEIGKCIDDIELSANEFENTDGNNDKAFSVTPMKIFWIVFALALFVSSQIYLFKKTKKA